MPINKRGAERIAKRVFISLRQMFRYALVREWIEVDPTVTISKETYTGSKGEERKRFLSDDEIKMLVTQMPAAGLTKKTTVAIWIVLSTGCRIGELLRARWEHIDLEKRRWFIPVENSKNKLSIAVYLSDFTLKQFKELEKHKLGGWLYPARNNRQGDIHVNSKTITKQIGDRQRVEAMNGRSKSTETLVLSGGRWTMHDLRRTASTMMGKLGIKPEVIDRCLNHKEENKVRRIYQQYNYQPEMNQAWQLLGERLEALTSTWESATIIPLRVKDTKP